MKLKISSALDSSDVSVSSQNFRTVVLKSFWAKAGPVFFQVIEHSLIDKFRETVEERLKLDRRNAEFFL